MKYKIWFKMQKLNKIKNNKKSFIFRKKMKKKKQKNRRTRIQSKK